MANEQQPIIVIKKKVHGGGHHGGAWKVAYADFVTAMMALFIVLWLLSSTSKKEQQEIAGYFRDPKGTAANHGSDKVDLKKDDAPAKQDMAKLRTDLLHTIEKVDTLNKLRKQIDLTITPEGLRIELMESDKGTFFELGSAKATPAMIQLLQVLSAQLGKLPNTISVEGHTDSTPYAGQSTYGNWELSSDRANTARRLMQSSGVRLEQVSQVRGFANQRLRNPDKPLDPSNRRISLIVQSLPDTLKEGTIKDIADLNTKSEEATPANTQQEASEKSAHATGSADTSAAKPAAIVPTKGLSAVFAHFHSKPK